MDKQWCLFKSQSCESFIKNGVVTMLQHLLMSWQENYFAEHTQIPLFVIHCTYLFIYILFIIYLEQNS